MRLNTARNDHGGDASRLGTDEQAVRGTYGLADALRELRAAKNAGAITQEQFAEGRLLLLERRKADRAFQGAERRRSEGSYSFG